MLAPIPQWLGFTPPEFTEEIILQQLWKNYSLDGKLESLEGEREQNFRFLTSSDETFLVRISHLEEDSAMLDYHALALNHLNNVDRIGVVPKMINTVESKHNAYLGQNKNILRVFSYLPGKPLSQGDVSGLKLALNAGLLLGQTTQQLAKLKKPDISYFMSWDMTNGLLSQDLLWSCAGKDLLKYRSGLLTNTCIPVLAAIKDFRQTFVHNDAHLDNMLRNNNADLTISGLIDFGDAMVTQPICDLAILCLGFADSSQTPEQSIASAAAGYHEQYPLLKQELDVLWSLVLTRELFSLLLFDYKIYHDVSATDYVREARPHMAENLIKLLTLNTDSIRDALFDACKI
ncbi:MAG: hydroxylysine kinase [Gammaproteobacteria bacterium]|jgi:hydroxylysine kinase